jgi:hypothetical protein
LFSSWHVVSLQFEIRWSFCLGKANWKKEIKDKIQEYWEKQWIEEAKKRTSLKFLAIPKMGKTHYVWKTVPNDHACNTVHGRIQYKL